jgi:hypothetical protein
VADIKLKKRSPAWTAARASGHNRENSQSEAKRILTQQRERRERGHPARLERASAESLSFMLKLE